MSDVEDIEVYDENDNKVNLEANKKKKYVAAKKRGKEDKLDSVTNLYCLFNIVLYELLGTKYLESGKARANARYNHSKGFQRKMKELKTVTGDDVLVEIRHNVTPPVTRRWSTNQEMFSRCNSNSSSTTITSPSSAITSPCSSVANMDPTSAPTTSTPSSRRKKKNDPKKMNRDVCQKCLTIYGSRTDNEYNSLWVNCAKRKCDYWVHAYCIGLVINEKDEEKFDSTVKYYCPPHNPMSLPRPKSLLKKRL